jgi:hypothetical protein
MKIVIAMLVGALAGFITAKATNAPSLPWQSEMPLREAAQSAFFESALDPTNPQPDSFGAPLSGPAMSIDNLKMRTVLWGPPNRITIRIHLFPVAMKTNEVAFRNF